MLGSQLAGIRSTSVQRANQTLGTLNSQEFPAMYPTLHCKFPASKFQPLQITESRRSKTGCSTTPHNSTDTFDPNRRPYTTERLLFTHNTGCRFAVPIRRTVHSSLNATKRQSQTWSSPRINVLNSIEAHTQCSSSCSKCETQFRLDALTPVTKLQWTAATRKTAMKSRWSTVTKHRTHTNALVHDVPTSVSFFPSG